MQISKEHIFLLDQLILFSQFSGKITKFMWFQYFYWVKKYSDFFM